MSNAPDNTSEQPQDAPKQVSKGSKGKSRIVVKKQNKVVEFIIKTVAVFIISAISAIGVGALLGVDPWKTTIIAGVVGLLRVVEDIAKGYLDDGQVTLDEIDTAFKQAGDSADENAQTI